MLSSSHLLSLSVLISLVYGHVPDQDPNDTNLDGCYPVAPSGGGALRVLKAARTPNGFHRAARGWNSWGIEANPETTPSYTEFNQEFVMAQCSVLAERPFVEAGWDMCSLDAGWSDTVGTDEFGRVTYNSSIFDIPALGKFLHGKGLKLGIYVIPGAPCSAANKTVKGTHLTLNDIMNGNNDGVEPDPYCDFDYANPATQIWYDSLLELWSSWGVDMIKLDFMTPGSIQNGANLVANNSGAAIAYHRAIQRSGRQIHLGLSWKLCRNDTYYDIWRSTAETLRTDQDINFSGTDTLLQWWPVQREIDNYRQYIALQATKNSNEPITIYPDMDNLYIGNKPNISGVPDTQRITVMSHWIGAAANLITGADMTNLDALGRQLFTSRPSIDAADFCSQYPMQPRNPGTGQNLAKQLQGWIAGPDGAGNAYALLTNLGPNLEGSAGFDTLLNGTQTVTVSLNDLGLTGSCYRATDVWFGHEQTVRRGGSFSADLSEGESQFLKLNPCY